MPLPAGEQQTLTVALIPGETVFFALRTFDEQNNGSAVSNVIEVTAGEGTVVFEDSFESGGADWQATGLWHVTQRKASDGSSSFWYGDEASGNYDTGDTNAGELLSPAVDLTGADNPILVFSTEFDVEAGDTFDRMIITAFDEADPTINVELNELDGFSDGFQNRAVSLAGMSDRSIRVRFSFDTVDSVANSTEGWFLDNVKVISDKEIIPADLLINEVLADPGSFDANNDGEISFRSDEFVEIVNLGAVETSLAGITIEDSQRVRFTFPEDASIEPGGVVVVFGGGAPNIGLPSFTAGNLSLNNLGETVTLRAANGSVLSTVSYGSLGGRNQSLNRETDGDRDAAFVLHTTVGGSVASPGTKADGSPFANAPTTGAELLINEILSDPSGAIDANQDGVFHSTQDEFIEIVNIGAEAIDLSGTFYNDAVGGRFKLPDNTVLDPGGVLVLFGGGAVNQAAFEGVTVVTAGGSLFLNNGGDVVSLTTAGGTTLVQANFGGSDGHSLTRSTDLSPFAPLVNHATLSGLPASPGRRNDGSAF